MSNQNTCIFIYPDSEQCTRETEGNNQHCICHLEDKKKDSEKFWKEFDKIRKSNLDLLDYSGFYFVQGKGKDFIFPEPDQINRDVSFEGAKFSVDYGELVKVTFKGHVNFKNAEFLGDSYLIWCKFEDDVSFVNTKFANKVSFSNSTFYGLADFAGFRGNLHERNLGKFTDPEYEKKY